MSDEKRWHVSEDGVVRRCVAKRPEDCRAKGPTGEPAEHFTDEVAATQRAEVLNLEAAGGSMLGTLKAPKGKKSLMEMVDHPELKSSLGDERMQSLLEERDWLEREFAEIYDVKNPDLEEATKIAEMSDELELVKKKISDIKDYNASLIKEAFPEPIERELQVPEGFKKIAEYESGTSEWLKARQSTLGGSDAGSLVYAHEVYGESNYSQIRQSKLDLDPEDQEHSGAQLRGDLWEPALIDLASKELGEQVYVNKGTFREFDPETGEDLYRHVNLDGFTVNEDGSIKAIVEAKTSSNPEEWEDGKIPPGYVLQTQHYMDCLGVDKAYIAVNIDDQELKMIEVTPETKTIATERAGKRMDLRLEGEYNYHDIKDYAVGKVKELNAQREKTRAEGGPKAQNRRWKESWGKALENPAGLAFMDIETSHFSEKKGHVLQVAVFKEGKDGKLEKFNQFYGIPEKHEEWNGTGREDIHNISVDDVRGLRPLRYDPQAQQELRDFLTDDQGRRMTAVAHNINHERKFFRGAIGIDDLEWADTLALYAGLGDEDRPDNTLESLVEESGEKYEDAHRADTDTLMMYRAYKDYLLPKMRAALSR